MLGNIYEVPVQLGMYHSFILSEYTLCCMCVWFQVHMQMITKESPLNMMRQPFGTVAYCGLVILQLQGKLKCLEEIPPCYHFVHYNLMWTSLGLNLYLCIEKLVTSHWS